MSAPNSEAVCAQIERMAVALQQAASAEARQEADRFLQQMRSSYAKPYLECRMVLSQSRHAAAHYQALNIIKAAVLREWSLLPPAEIEALRNGLIVFAVERGAALERYVLNQVCHVVAVIYKRGWFPDEQQAKNLLLSQVQKLLSTNETRSVAMSLCQAALSQFASGQSSELGQSWEFHIRAHRSFEVHALRPMVEIVVKYLEGAVSTLAQGKPDDLAVFGGCLHVLDTALSWEFVEKISNAELQLRSLQASEGEGDASSALVQPGAAWAPLLLSAPGMLEWLFAADRGVKQLAPRPEFAAPAQAQAIAKIGDHVRQCLFHMASLSGSIFAPAPVPSSLAPSSSSSSSSASSSSVSRVQVDHAAAAAAIAEANRVKAGYVARLVKGASHMLNSVVQEYGQLVSSSAASSSRSLSASAALGSEILSLCQFYQRLISNFGLVVILQMPDDGGALASGGQAWMEQLAALTCLLLNPSLSDTVNTWTSESFDILLSSWVHLLSDFEDKGRHQWRQQQIEQVTAILKTSTDRIFQRYVELRLALARQEMTKALAKKQQQQQSKQLYGSGRAQEEDDEDDEDDHDQFYGEAYEDEQLASMALVGRVHAVQTLGMLASLINARTADLSKIASSRPSPGGSSSLPLPLKAQIATLHEELHWLIRLIGYVLADQSEGETSLIPDGLIRTSRNTNANSTDLNADPVVAATQTVFNFIQLENALIQSEAKQRSERKQAMEEKDALLSPLLAETLVWFMQRWSGTYLMPEESLYGSIAPRLWQAWGEGAPGAKQALDFIVQKAYINLVHWSEEEELSVRCCQLLHGLVSGASGGGSKRARRYVSLTGAWQGVVRAYQASFAPSVPSTSASSSSSSERPLANLRGAVLRKLVQALLMAAGDGPENNEQKRQEACMAVLGPIDQRLQSLLQHPQFKLMAQKSAFVDDLYTALNMMRGVACATGKHTFEFAFGFLSKYFAALVSLMSMYGALGDSSIVNVVLKLFRDIADSEIMYLSAKQSEHFMTACLNLVKEYGTVNAKRLARLRGGSSRAAASEAQAVEEDQFNDVQTLLSLLQHLISKDLFDLSTDSVDFASDAVLSCLSLLVPHLNEQLMNYTDVCCAYFRLVHDLLTTHVDKFATATTPAVRSAVLSTLAFAISHHQVEVAKNALSSVAALAQYHVQQREGTAGKRFGRGGKGGGKGLNSEHKELTPQMQQPQGAPSTFAADLTQFLQRFFHMLLFQHFSAELLEPISDALFPLIMALPQEYQQFVQQFIQSRASQQQPQQAQRLAEGFTALTADIKHELNRENRLKFRANVRAFVQNVRSLVQSK